MTQPQRRGHTDLNWQMLCVVPVSTDGFLHYVFIFMSVVNIFCCGLLDTVTDLTALLLPVKPQTTHLQLSVSCALISIFLQMYLNPQSTFLQIFFPGISGSLSSSGPCNVHCMACLAMLSSVYDVCPV